MVIAALDGSLHAVSAAPLSSSSNNGNGDLSSPTNKGNSPLFPPAGEGDGPLQLEAAWVQPGKATLGEGSSPPSPIFSAPRVITVPGLQPPQPGLHPPLRMLVVYAHVDGLVCARDLRDGSLVSPPKALREGLYSQLGLRLKV